MDETERRDHLSTIRLFARALDADQLDELAAKARPVVFPAGAVLMTSGDFGNAMYVVVEGTVTVELIDEQGAEREIADLGKGDIVGEMSLMTGARRNATVIAKTDVETLEITKVALEEIFARAPVLVDRFSVVLARRQTELDRIASETAHSADDVAGQIRRFFQSVFSTD